MALTAKQTFRLNVLQHFAAQGLQPEEIKQQVKQAMVKVAFPGAKSFGAGAGAVSGAASTAAWPVWAWPLLGAASVGSLGMAGGYTAGKAMQNEPDPEDIKRQELRAALMQHAERLRRNNKTYRYRHTGSPFDVSSKPIARLK